MPTATPTYDQIVEGLRTANIALDPDGQRHAVALLRAVGEGDPVSASELASRTGQSPEEAQAFLDSIPGVYKDDDGSVVGFWGLANTHFPPHEYKLNGRDLFTWCAWDPFILTDWLGGNAEVRSVDAQTKEPLGFRIENGKAVDLSHDGLVLSFKYVEEWDHDVIASFCHFVHFFTDRTSAEAWTAEQPDTFVLSLDDGIRLGKEWGRLVFPDLTPDA